MSLPPPPAILEAAHGVLVGADGGDTDPIAELSPLSGGSIHPAARLRTRSGQVAFLKWKEGEGGPSFVVESRGLRALASVGALPVPKVRGVDDGPAGSWLLLEYIPPGTPTWDSWARLGRGLARLHSTPVPQVAGWPEDGFIGPLPQSNTPTPSWPDFWREARLLPRWREAESAGLTSQEMAHAFARVVEGVDGLLAGWEDAGYSILHGDLWSGNVLTDARGAPWLIDPAVYRGSAEVDLAMMELFGGFPSAVMQGYREVRPIAPEYGERRRSLYQLYPLLVHLILFGDGYRKSVERTLDRLVRLLG